MSLLNRMLTAARLSANRLSGDSAVFAGGPAIRSNRGFTLIELLVVIGIMGLMGTVSVGGYRAMQRGMEERGVMQNVNAIIKTAYERAQIDRRPTVMYFWNETIRSRTDDENEIVVGRAVAVRQQGRLTFADGTYLVDEFADLNLSFGTAVAGDAEGEEDEQAGDGTGDVGENTMFLYCLDRLTAGEAKMRSVVSARVYGGDDTKSSETYFHETPTDTENGDLTWLWGFKVENANGVTWKKGSAYGFEFAEITLPHNYIFGSDYSESAENQPIKGENSMVFVVGRNYGTDGVTSLSQSTGSITVYSLRPDGSGGLKAEKVDTNDMPYD